MRRVLKWNDEWLRIALGQIVRHSAPVLQHRDCVLEAVAPTNRGAGGFADRVIGALNRDAGCETTLTFDRDAATDRDFQLLTT